MNQEDWRRVYRNPDVRREGVLVDFHSRRILFDKVSRIDRDREIRPATLFVDGVRWLVGTLIEVSGGCQRQVPAG
jgi:hypothetical protein